MGARPLITSINPSYSYGSRGRSRLRLVCEGPPGGPWRIADLLLSASILILNFSAAALSGCCSPSRRRRQRPATAGRARKRRRRRESGNGRRGRGRTLANSGVPRLSNEEWKCKGVSKCHIQNISGITCLELYVPYTLTSNYLVMSKTAHGPKVKTCYK